MKSSSDDKNHYTIPSPQFRCVWMTAGILSYQLCDREFDCDRCPLDSAMRMHFSKNEKSVHTEKSTESNEPQATEYLYSRNHAWVKPISDDIVRVGIEPIFSAVLVSPRAVVLPTAGDKLKQNECSMWVVVEGGTVPIVSPISGIVCGLNIQMSVNPHELSVQPLTVGWLYELDIEADALPLSNLMKFEDAKKIYADDRLRFNTMLSDALKGSHQSLGLTIHDGGQTLSDIVAMIGPKCYFELIRKVFG